MYCNCTVQVQWKARRWNALGYSARERVYCAAARKARDGRQHVPAESPLTRAYAPHVAGLVLYDGAGDTQSYILKKHNGAGDTEVYYIGEGDTQVYYI